MGVECVELISSDAEPCGPLDVYRELWVGMLILLATGNKDWDTGSVAVSDGSPGGVICTVVWKVAEDGGCIALCTGNSGCCTELKGAGTGANIGTGGTEIPEYGGYQVCGRGWTAQGTGPDPVALYLHQNRWEMGKYIKTARMTQFWYVYSIDSNNYF